MKQTFLMLFTLMQLIVNAQTIYKAKLRVGIAHTKEDAVISSLSNDWFEVDLAAFDSGIKIISSLEINLGVFFMIIDYNGEVTPLMIDGKPRDNIKQEEINIPIEIKTEENGLVKVIYYDQRIKMYIATYFNTPINF